MSKDSIVYSTDPEWKKKCPECDQPLEACVCNSKRQTTGQTRVIYIRREVKGRKGKTVSTVSNIGGEVKNVQKELQRLCGAGGTVKNGIIEIQGDHRGKIKKFLEGKGYSVIMGGG